MANIRQTERAWLVKKAAREVGLNMKRLAEQLKVSRNTLYKVLNGEKRSDRLEHALELAFPDAIARWPFHGDLEIV